MSQLILAAIKQRRITLFLTAIIALAGVYVYFLIPKQENPDVAAPAAMLTTIYTGASPDEINQLVTKPIEKAATEVQGVDYTQSWSANSASIILVSLKNDVAPEQAWNELRRKIADAQRKLPSGAEKTEIDTKLIETAGMILSLSGENYSYEQLNAFAELIQDELDEISGISRFDIVGKVEKEVVVRLDIRKINHFGLSLDNIAQLLQAQNLSIPSGGISTPDTKIKVRVPGAFASFKDIENIILNVSPKTGAQLRLKDVATVRVELKEDAKKIRQDGANTVLLAGFFQPKQNIVLVGEEVREVLEQTKEKLPTNVNLTEVTFEPEDIDASVSDFMLNVVQGVLLVIVVVFIGMGLRNAIVVSLAIPLSIVITFLAMYYLGIKIHQISTTALIIALGMLVDNAIVISDAIQVRIDQGMEKIQAAYEGTIKSAVPILTATLTTVAAFSPLLSLPGATGDFLLAIPQIVILSLSASYLVALVVTPALSVVLFKPSKKTTGKKRNRLRFFFIKGAERGLKRRWLTLCLAFFAFFIALILSEALPSQLFPNADKNIVYIDITSDAVDIKKTDALTKQIEEILEKQPEVFAYTSSIGDDLPRFYITASISVPSADFAQIMMRVNPEETERFRSYNTFAQHLQKEIDQSLIGGSATVRLLESTDPKEGSVIMRVSGKNIDLVLEKARQIQDQLTNLSGTINVRNDAVSKVFNYRLDILEDHASMYGLTKYDVQRQINLALLGDKVSTYRKGGRALDIRLKSNVSSLGELTNMPVPTSNGQQSVLIKQITENDLFPEFDIIKKYNEEITVSIFCNTTDAISPIAIEDQMEHEILPLMNLAGVDVSFAGEREDIKRDFGNLGDAALVAFVLIYIILLFQFKSFVQPVVIMVSVPLSLVGAISGLLIFNQPLSFTALLGVASLIGIVVNNAILLIEFINDAIAEGLPVIEACKDAVKKRFRPIVLSTSTTVMGLVPLALSGSELFIPMAIALMFGLVFSTLLTMIVIPVVYRLMVRV